MEWSGFQAPFIVRKGQPFEGGCLTDLVLNPWAYIFQSSKKGPIGGVKYVQKYVQKSYKITKPFFLF